MLLTKHAQDKAVRDVAKTKPELAGSTCVEAIHSYVKTMPTKVGSILSKLQADVGVRIIDDSNATFYFKTYGNGKQVAVTKHNGAWLINEALQ